MSDLADSWKMTDEEAKEMLSAIDESWKKWRLHDSISQPSQVAPKGKNKKGTDKAGRKSTAKSSIA